MRGIFLVLFVINCSIVNSQIISPPRFDRVVLDTLGYDSLGQVLYRSGKLYYQVPFKNGKVNGWYEEFYENGTISGKKLRVDGIVVDGENIFYWDNGAIYQKGYYKNGHQVGKWYDFDKDGQPFYLQYYNKKGIPIKAWRWNSEKKKWEKSNLL
jgi:antitoxin component YwqK of YwqJK toxin-antitoxin module